MVKIIQWWKRRKVIEKSSMLTKWSKLTIKILRMTAEVVEEVTGEMIEYDRNAKKSGKFLIKK